jgi:hypothetical protein
MNKYLIINNDNILDNIIKSETTPILSDYTVKEFSTVNGSKTRGSYYDSGSNTLFNPTQTRCIYKGEPIGDNPFPYISGSTSITYSFSQDITLSELDCINPSYGTISNYNTSSNSLTFDLDPTGGDLTGNIITLNFKNTTIITDHVNRIVPKPSYEIQYTGSI